MIHALGDDCPELAEDCYVAKEACLIGRVRLASGSSVWPHATLRGDNEWIEVGPDSNIQDNSVLHTDMGAPLTLGRGVTVGHLVMLHGCTIGDFSLIGIGSVILNHVRIGRNVIIGAKSLVTEGKEIPDGHLVMGAPAKIVRELTDQEKQMLAASAAHYRENGRRHATGLREVFRK